MMGSAACGSIGIKNASEPVSLPQAQKTGAAALQNADHNPVCPPAKREYYSYESLDVSKSLTDFQRVFLLLLWLGAFGIVVVLGLDTRARSANGELIEVWRLFIPLVASGLITLIVHLSNRMK